MSRQRHQPDGDPVRIKLYGLFWITKRGYVMQLIVGAIMAASLLGFWICLRMPGRPLFPPKKAPSFWEALGPWLLDNLHLIVLAMIVLYGIEALMVFRRFAQSEAEQRKGKPRR